MKRNYYFVKDLAGFTPDSVVYTVAVGASEREQVKFSLVREFAADCNLYFSPVSDVSDRAIDKLSSSLFPGCLMPRLRLKRAKISISQLYSMIVDDSFAEFEATVTSSKSALQTLTILDPSFLFKASTRQSNTFLSAAPRKYLKSEQRNSVESAIVGFCLILVVYVIASIISSTEVYY